jgi:hypothetical protein
VRANRIKLIGSNTAAGIIRKSWKIKQFEQLYSVVYSNRRTITKVDINKNHQTLKGQVSSFNINIFIFYFNVNNSKLLGEKPIQLYNR